MNKTLNIIGEYSNELLDALRDSDKRTKHNPNRWIPKPGDKVVLTEEAFECMSGKEAMKLARLPYCTVEEVGQIPLGENGDYEWYYEIYIEEAPGSMIGINYVKY